MRKLITAIISFFKHSNNPQPRNLDANLEELEYRYRTDRYM